MGDMHFFQVFEGVLDIIEMVNFGYEKRETPTMVHIEIKSKAKLRSVLQQASDLDFLVRRKSTGEMAEISITTDAPFCVSYSKRKERIFITFSYMWYNMHGIPQ